MSDQAKLVEHEDQGDEGKGNANLASSDLDDGIAPARTSAVTKRTFGAGGVGLPGKRTRVQARYSAMPASKADQPSPPEQIMAAAIDGVQGTPGKLPHLDRIQESFGDHDLCGVRAYVGGAAAASSEAIGAEAYATGDQVAFRKPPDLHTAAHEAAHVVQQREGVQLKGGVGEVGDAYEQQADRAADAVLRGDSAATVLGHASAAGGQSGAIQMRGKKKSKKAKPTFATLKSCGDTKQHGAAAGFHYGEASKKADLVYPLVETAMGLEKTHRIVVKDYERQSEAYDQAMKAAAEKSDLATMIELATSLVSVGTAAYGLYSGVKTLIQDAKAARNAWESAKDLAEFGYGEAPTWSGEGWDAAKKLGKDTFGVGKDAKDVATGFAGSWPGGSVGSGDPTKDLVDTVQNGLRQSNDAVLRFANQTVLLHLNDMGSTASEALLCLAQQKEDMENFKKDRAILPAAGIDAIGQSVALAQEAARVYVSKAERTRQLWVGYQAGGLEGLSDERERSLFDLIAQWVRDGDPKVGALHVAADENCTEYHFDPKVHNDEKTKGGGGSEIWRCHAFDTVSVQFDRGVLYITDPEVQALLEPRLRGKFWHETLTSGGAEDLLTASFPDAWSGICSASLAKALVALGVKGTQTDAEVRFSVGGSAQKTIKGPHSGDWNKRWWETPAFARYWQASLGGRWGYLFDKRESKRLEFAAGAARRRASHTIEWPTYDGVGGA